MDDAAKTILIGLAILLTGATPIILLWLDARAKMAQTKLSIMQSQASQAKLTANLRAETAATLDKSEARTSEIVGQAIEEMAKKNAHLEEKLHEAVGALDESGKRESAAIKRIVGLQIDLQVSRRANKQLVSDNEILRRDNQSLRDELTTVKKDLSLMRDELARRGITFASSQSTISTGDSEHHDPS